MGAWHEVPPEQLGEGYNKPQLRCGFAVLCRECAEKKNAELAELREAIEWGLASAVGVCVFLQPDGAVGQYQVGPLSTSTASQRVQGFGKTRVDALLAVYRQSKEKNNDS